jgi:ribosomal protein L14
MKKNKKQNFVAKYARKVCKAVRMRDRTKYRRYDKHKVKYQDSDNT